MAGIFNRKAKAANVHNMVVMPKTGKIPNPTPNAMLKAIFLRLIPSLSIDFTNLNIFVFIRAIS
jgi:hypothetical protein